VHTGFGWGDLRKRDDLEDLVVGARIISKFIFKNRIADWTGLI
jgi:hypothetical protein